MGGKSGTVVVLLHMTKDTRGDMHNPVAASLEGIVQHFQKYSFDTAVTIF